MKELVRKLAAVSATLLLVFSVTRLYFIFAEYRKGSEVYRKIVEEAVIEEKPECETGTLEKEKSQQGPQIDFAALERMNPDVAGFITMEGLGIVYPVVRGEDNTHYLSHTFTGEENAAGAIFMNCGNHKDFSDGNTIIFGHNMKDGSMFGKLKELRNPETFMNNREFYLSLPGENRKYEIFSCHTAESGGEVYRTFPEKGKEYQEYLVKMQSLSEVPVEVALTAQEEIITLSTCIGDGKERFVIQARRIRI